MRILLASSSSGSRGGGELYLLYLARALAGRGHEPALWCSDDAKMDELAATFAAVGSVHRSPYPNTYDRRLRSLSAAIDGATAQRVADAWREIGCDLIHLNKQNLEDGLDLLAAARLVTTPTICTIHLTQSARYLRAVLAPLRDYVSRRALHAYAGLQVTVLENRLNDLRAFLGDSPRLRVIPNGVPLFNLSQRSEKRVAQRRELRIADHEILVVAVGRLVPQKRPLVFLEQAKRALAVEPNFRFVWVGDGELANDWDARVRELGLESSVQRLPWQKDVVSTLFAADVFLHVAEFEGLPLAILEAMSAGCPCAIAANLLAEMPFFKADDVVAVDDSGSWISAAQDSARRYALGQRARRIAEEQFSYEQMAARYEELYRETLGASP